MADRSADIYEFGDFRFETDSFRLFQNGGQVQIPHKAAALLRLFLEQSGTVLKKEEIYQELWGDEIVEETNLTRTIYLLRKTLGAADSSGRFIETLPKIGYRFRGQVKRFQAETETQFETELQLEEEISTAATRPQAVFPSVMPAAPEQSETASIETQILLVKPVSPPLAGGDTAWAIFIRRVKVSPFKAAAEFAPRVWQSRRMKIATLTVLPLLVVCLAILFSARISETAGVKVRSLAVLPFSELDQENRASTQGLGIADTLISRLGNFENIEVRPTSAIRSFIETEFDPREAGRKLQVEAVLTGTIQRQNTSVRVSAQLIRVADNKILWSESFDEPASEILKLQDKLSDKLIAEIRLPVPENSPRGQINRRGTESLAAYNHYLKGRLFWNRRTPEWIQKAIAEFEEAVKIDPNFAQAYAGIADSYALTVSGLPAAERMPRARAAAEKALEIDSGLAEAHASLGFIKYKFYMDWRGAEESLKYAVKLNPNYATAHHWLGELLAIVGRFDEALQSAEQAERLDPLSLPIKKDVGMVYYNWRRYDRAAEKIKETLAIDPNYAGARQNLALVYFAQGNLAESLRESLFVEEKTNQSAAQVEALKAAVHASGWNGFWRKKLELGFPSADDGFARASVYLRLGEKQTALDWLEKSFDEKSSVIFRIKTDPLLDPLRNEPRFLAMLRRAGFEN